MNKKILSLGFLVAILLAVTAFPTGNSLPTGIEDPNMVANGCTCHTTGPMSSDVIINLTQPSAMARAVGSSVVNP